MFELIMETEKIDANKNNITLISSDFIRYILLVDKLVEFDITNKINSTFEINFKNTEEISTINITFNSGECLYNIPFKARNKQ